MQGVPQSWFLGAHKAFRGRRNLTREPAAPCLLSVPGMEPQLLMNVFPGAPSDSSLSDHSEGILATIRTAGSLSLEFLSMTWPGK